MKKKIVQGRPTDLHVSLAFAFALMLACSLHGGTATRSFSWYRNAAQTDFQVPITLEEGVDGFTYADTAADGSDLRVADQNGVSLPLEIERWNPNGRSVVWVKVPNFSSSTVLALSWGDDATAEEVDASGLWSDMMAVFHFGSTGGLNSANGDILPGSVPTEPAIGQAASFDRTESYLLKNIPASHYGANAIANFTISFWMKTDRLTRANDQTYLLQWGANDTQQAILLNWNGDAFVRFYWFKATEGTWGGSNNSDVKIPQDGVWHHFAFTYDGATYTAYLDGFAASTASFAGFSIKPWETVGFFSIGATQTKSYPFHGSLDEVRFETVCRSADWIRAAAETQAQLVPGMASVTVPFSDYGGAELHDFPAYVYLDENTGFDIGALHRDLTNGTVAVSDMRTGEILPVEIEHAFVNEFDRSLGLWVKMPRYSAADGVVISRDSSVYKPHSGAGSAVDPSQVWDADEYMLVYHMNPTGLLNDVVSRNVKLNPCYMQSTSKSAAAYPMATTGPTGRYQAYRSTTNASQKAISVSIPHPITNVYTVSWWAKEDADEFANPKRETYLWSMLGIAAIKGIGYKSQGAAGNTMVIYPGGSQCKLTIPDDQWHHYAYTADGSKTRCYRDGVLQTEASQVKDLGFSSSVSGGTVILTGSTNARKDSFRGCVDEVRLENVCRSADWLLAEYQNQQAWRNGTPWQYAPHFASSDAGVISASDSGALTAQATLSCRTSANVTFCWGRTDGGTSLEGWEHTESLGPRTDGTVAATVTLPVSGARYAYRFFAQNSYGRAWTPARFAAVPVSDRRGATVKLKIAYDGDETLVGFPLCVRIPAANGLPESPASVRFMDETGRTLAYEVEVWNPAEESVVWVRVPELTSSTELTLRFDRAFPTGDGDWAKDAMWRPDEFAGVWHMGTPAGSGTVLDDSTSFGGDITSNTLGAFATNGVAGEAFHWPRLVSTGNMQNKAGGSPFNDFLNGFSFSFWAKMPDEPTKTLQTLIKHELSDKRGVDGYHMYLIRYGNTEKTFDFHVYASHNTFLPGGGNVYLDVHEGDRNQAAEVVWASSMERPDDGWHHYAFVHDGLFLSAYRDGELVRSVLWPFVLNTAYQDNKLMRTSFGNNINQYNLMLGSLDEYRAERVGRSASWIKACYDNQRPGSTFVSVGPTFRKGIVLSIR